MTKSRLIDMLNMILQMSQAGERGSNALNRIFVVVKAQHAALAPIVLEPLKPIPTTSMPPAEGSADPPFSETPSGKMIHSVLPEFENSTPTNIHRRPAKKKPNPR